ncbi:hypothetical protein JCM8547_007489 [Rhodosporidiobolus lusitaniae]
MSALPLQTGVFSTGVCLAYLDSWSSLPSAERPRNFTTLVALHGTAHNSTVWEPLLPFLPPSIRLIAYNQRDYKGSSPAFEPKESGGVDATAQYVVDLAKFLKFVVEEKGARKKEEGGVVLLGWSKGTVPLVALLSLLHQNPSFPLPSGSFASFLPSTPSSEAGTLPHLSFFTSHLRSIILFEAPTLALGLPPTPDLLEGLSPVLPPNTPTPEEFATAFENYVGGYSDPLPFSSEPPSSALPPAGPLAYSPEFRKAVFEPRTMLHSFSWWIGQDDAQSLEVAKRALKPEEELKVPVGLLYGGRTLGVLTEAARAVEGWWKEMEEEGKKVGKKGETRQMTAVRCIPLTNHFVNVSEPEKFVKAVVELIEELGEGTKAHFSSHL